jgi:hypothetical protein
VCNGLNGDSACALAARLLISAHGGPHGDSPCYAIIDSIINEGGRWYVVDVPPYGRPMYAEILPSIELHQND